MKRAISATFQPHSMSDPMPHPPLPFRRRRREDSVPPPYTTPPRAPTTPQHDHRDDDNHPTTSHIPMVNLVTPPQRVQHPSPAPTIENCGTVMRRQELTENPQQETVGSGSPDRLRPWSPSPCMCAGLEPLTGKNA